MNKINYFQCEFKEIEMKEGKIKIKGFASTPDIDRYNDIVNPKSFNNAIEGYMKNPVILLQHNWDKPIWKATDYTLTRRWLEVKVELTNDIDNTFKLIQDWVLKGFSIWFIPKKWEYKTQDQLEIREITDLDLVEISVVSTPANQNSLFTLTKSVKNFFDWINLINNTEIMEEIIEEKTIETKIDEVIEVKETITPQIEETILWDEVEISSENLDTDKAQDEELKSLKDMIENSKQEIEELKNSINSQNDLINNLLDNVLELSKRTAEVKSTMDNLPIKKGLATLWTEKKAVDPLFQELMKAKNNI